MKAGISTSCLFPMLLEDALAHVVGMGVRSAEIFLNTESERTPAFARLLRERADAGGASLVSVHPYSSEYEGIQFFTRYPRRFPDAVEDYRRYFEFCNIIGAKLLVFHGMRTLIPVEPALYYERFAALSEAAQAYGVTICQENVTRFYAGEYAFLEGLLKAVPRAGVVIDLKQARRAGEDAFALLSLAGKNLRHIHVSDYDETHDCLIPGQGCFDFARMVALLQEINYEGQLMLEVYRSNYRQEEELFEGYRLLAGFTQ